MNAEFKTDAGTVYRVTLEAELSVPQANLVGRVSATESTSRPQRRVLLTTSYAWKSSDESAIETPLTRSEARAIASALMGAAAEL